MDNVVSVDGFVDGVWMVGEWVNAYASFTQLKTLILQCNFNKYTHTSYTIFYIFDISFSDNVTGQKDRVIYIIPIIYAEIWG